MINNPHTRIVNNVELSQAAMGTSILPGEGEFPVVVCLRGGTVWQLDGVRWIVDEQGNALHFELQVGPKEEQTP